jgi:hypothetical protein
MNAIKPINCETQGHLWNAGGLCVMCKAPRPADDNPKNGWRQVSQGIDVPREHFSMRAFVKGVCRVLVTHEDHDGRMRWHLSISCEKRYPGWEEIKDARYSLLPLPICFAMMLPPPDKYVNVHPNCFHLWEIDDGEW